MTYVPYDPIKAADTARLKGTMIGYAAGAFSNADTSCIAAASIEALNQDGYSIYQDEFGNFDIRQDRNTYGGNVWYSDMFGGIIDNSGDTVKVTIPNSAQSTTYTPVAATGGNTAYDSILSDFRNSGEQLLHQYQQSLNTGVNVGTLGNLQMNEAVDPITGQYIDKEKSDSIDALLNKESTQYKFDKIIKLMNRTYNAQSAAEVTVSGKAKTLIGGTAATAGAGAMIGTLICPGPGTAIGAAIGGVVGFIGGLFVNGSDQSKADKLNKEAENEAKAASEELNAALQDLLKEGNEEELIAFERYYYEQTGMKLADALKALEVTEDSSDIAKNSCINDEYISKILAKIDDRNEYLLPDEEEVQEVEQPKTYSEAEQMQINGLKQKMNLCKQAYYMSLESAEGKATYGGKEMTSQELLNEMTNLEAQLNALL